MIPFAILKGELIQPDRLLEIRILDLSFDSFTFRLSHRHGISGCVTIRLDFFSREVQEYHTVELKDIEVQTEEEERFWTVYRVYTEDPHFISQSRILRQEYQTYIDLKLSGNDAVLSEQMTGYPAAEEQQYPSSFNAWMKNETEAASMMNESGWNSAVAETALGIQLESDVLLDAFLHMEWQDFLEFYWKRQNLVHHPLSGMEIRYVYFGSGYCFECLPDPAVMGRLLEKAAGVGRKAVVFLPPLKHRYEQAFLNYLETLAAYGKTEVAVNDWGCAEVIRKKYAGRLIPIMGVLLNKRRKDSRMRYRLGAQQQEELLKTNAVNDETYRRVLRDTYGMTSFVFESCGQTCTIPDGEHTVLFPFYQMNTAGHCTMYAYYHTGSRGAQSEERCCPRYCRNHIFLYPSFLKMVGKGNTVSGFDDSVLKEEEVFRRVSGEGTQRMVLMELFLEGEKEETV